MAKKPKYSKSEAASMRKHAREMLKERHGDLNSPGTANILKKATKKLEAATTRGNYRLALSALEDFEKVDPRYLLGNRGGTRKILKSVTEINSNLDREGRRQFYYKLNLLETKAKYRIDMRIINSYKLNAFFVLIAIT